MMDNDNDNDDERVLESLTNVRLSFLLTCKKDPNRGRVCSVMSELNWLSLLSLYRLKEEGAKPTIPFEEIDIKTLIGLCISVESRPCFVR